MKENNSKNTDLEDISKGIIKLINQEVNSPDFVSPQKEMRKFKLSLSQNSFSSKTDLNDSQRQ